MVAVVVVVVVISAPMIMATVANPYLVFIYFGKDAFAVDELLGLAIPIVCRAPVSFRVLEVKVHDVSENTVPVRSLQHSLA